MPLPYGRQRPVRNGRRRGMLAEAPLELAQEPRLAHAGLAHHGHEVRRALAHHALVEAVERSQLLAAPHERGLARRRHAADGVLRDEADRLPGGHALRLALQLERLELVVAHGRVRGAHGALADGHAAGPGGRLEPRGHVHGVADDRVGVAHRPGQHLAGVHPDAKGEVRAVREPVVHLGHGRLHPEAGPHRALRVVLVRHRGAEDRHHVVADVLVDGAAVALDLLAEPHQRAVHQRLHGLRVHPLRERGVAGEVGEQHGHLPPLLWQRRAGARRGGRCDGRLRAPSSADPQFMQKRASGGAGVPQLGQRRSSAAPQLMQKRAPAGLSVPHDAQVI